MLEIEHRFTQDTKHFSKRNFFAGIRRCLSQSDVEFRHDQDSSDKGRIPVTRRISSVTDLSSYRDREKFVDPATAERPGFEVGSKLKGIIETTGLAETRTTLTSMGQSPALQSLSDPVGMIAPTPPSSGFSDIAPWPVNNSTRTSLEACKRTSIEQRSPTRPVSHMGGIMQPESIIGALPSLDAHHQGTGISGADSPAGNMSRSSTSGSLSALAGSNELIGRRSSDSYNGTTHLSHGHAAEELFYRLNHARQTLDFVKRQAGLFGALDKCTMGIWEALELMNELREYEAALLSKSSTATVGDRDLKDGSHLDPDMSLLDHALQTAEACRLAFPKCDWIGLVGLLHSLGKLLAHAQFGAEPQWAICANPDRRRRTYSTPTGVYAPGCGLASVCMSWSGAEYLYLVLLLNKARIPREALWLIRHQNFAALLRGGSPYHELLSDFDRSMLPTLAKFRELKTYVRMEVPGRLEGADLRAYYNLLIEKYIPGLELKF